MTILGVHTLVWNLNCNALTTRRKEWLELKNNAIISFMLRKVITNYNHIVNAFINYWIWFEFCFSLPLHYDYEKASKALNAPLDELNPTNDQYINKRRPHFSGKAGTTQSWLKGWNGQLLCCRCKQLVNRILILHFFVIKLLT